MALRIVTADDVNRLLAYDKLIDALADAFRADITVPEKIAHFVPWPSGSEAKVLLMPAWTNSGERFIGHKLVNVFPDNAKAGKPSVLASYVLMSGTTGETLALIDGTALSPHLVRAHRAVRPITKVTLWNRTRSRAVATALALSTSGIEPVLADDLEDV